MSNTMSIEVVEVRTLSSNVVSYGILAGDNYGSYQELSYSTPEEIFAIYPTRYALVEMLFGLDTFEGSGVAENGPRFRSTFI